MTGTDDVLAQIGDVLGFEDDMTIEWDHTTGADAMRSRPRPPYLEHAVAPPDTLAPLRARSASLWSWLESGPVLNEGDTLWIDGLRFTVGRVVQPADPENFIRASLTRFTEGETE